MFTHSQPHSCPYIITSANRLGKNLTFSGCLAISLLFHPAVCSAVFFLKANTVRAPRKSLISTRLDFRLRRFGKEKDTKTGRVNVGVSSSAAEASVSINSGILK